MLGLPKPDVQSRSTIPTIFTITGHVGRPRDTGGPRFRISGMREP